MPQVESREMRDKGKRNGNGNGKKNSMSRDRKRKKENKGKGKRRRAIGQSSLIEGIKQSSKKRTEIEGREGEER